MVSILGSILASDLIVPELRAPWCMFEAKVMESIGAYLASKVVFFDNLKVFEIGIPPFPPVNVQSDDRSAIGFITFLARTRLQRLTVTTDDLLHICQRNYDEYFSLGQGRMLKRTLCPGLKEFKIVGSFWINSGIQIASFLSTHKATLEHVDLRKCLHKTAKRDALAICNALLDCSHLSCLILVGWTFVEDGWDLYKRFNTMWEQSSADIRHPGAPISYDWDDDGRKIYTVAEPAIPYLLRFVQSGLVK